jgi:hypothetical protein
VTNTAFALSVNTATLDSNGKGEREALSCPLFCPVAPKPAVTTVLSCCKAVTLGFWAGAAATHLSTPWNKTLTFYKF